MHIEQEQHPIGSTCISVEGVSFSYGNEPVLEDVSFKVLYGDYLGIIGPNGGGKTTILKVILGLLKPHAGSVQVFGQEILALKTERSHIGYVPQRASQIDINFPATVEEIVASGRTAHVGLFHNFSPKDNAAVEKALEITAMTKYRTTLINSLSGGQRQRVFIARALAGDPQVLILDEPTVGVDIASQEQFYTFLRKLHQQHGLTTILVSHDIDVVSAEVKTLLFLNQKVISYGPSEELLTKDYLGQLYGKQMRFAAHHH